MQRFYHVAEEGDFDILIIHGVGNPAVGTIASTVAETLERTLPDRTATTRVCECNWNTIVEPSARDGGILWTALVDLSVSMARASAIGDGLNDKNGISRLFRTLSAGSLMAAEMGAAAALAGLLLLILVGLSLASVSNVGLLPSAVPVGVSIIRWCLLLTASALVVLIASGISRALITGAPAAFFVELRRAILLVFRPLFIVAFSFFFIPWRRVAGRVWMSLFLLEVFCLLPMMILLGLFATWNNPSGFEWSELSAATLKIYALLFGTTAAVFALGFVTIAMIAPSLKVALDIFRYVGEIGYRDTIQSHINNLLRQRFASVGTKRPIYVISHSLGTVIALDSLLSSDDWGPDAQVTLITLGSPIRRFFMRFFPGLFFPASVTEAATAISARMNFRWINCYRPLDQVGAALGFSHLSYCRDVSTYQWKRIWDAHPNYWGDEVVASAVTKALITTPMNFTGLEQRDPLKPAQYIADEGLDSLEKFRLQIFVGICRTVALAFLVSPVVVGVIVAWANLALTFRSTAENEVLQTTGIDTLAAVTHWRKKIPVRGAGWAFTDHFELSYEAPNGEVRSVPSLTYSNFEPFDETNHKVNPEALVSHIRSHCVDVDPRPPSRFEMEYRRKCRREDFRFRYDPNTPSRWVLSDFPPERSWLNVVWNYIFSFFATFLPLIFFGWWAVIIVAPLAAMILGLSFLKRL